LPKRSIHGDTYGEQKGAREENEQEQKQEETEEDAQPVLCEDIDLHFLSSVLQRSSKYTNA
jgi:hypothetical protein